MPNKVPKDFAGKAVTSKTYTKDWVFVKNKQPTGPNVSHGAWMTQQQARDLHEEQLKKRAANMAGQPKTAPLPSSGVAPIPAGSSPTGLGGPIPIGTEPPWWIGQAYTNPNADQSFANAANAMLPTLSPEDRRTMANYLATNFKDVFGGYATADFGPIPSQLTTERTSYLNPARAQAALSLLNRVKTASGGQSGPGYDFLNQAVNLMNQFTSNGQPMTREQYQLFTTALKNLAGQQGKDMSAYSSLAQMFGLPSFTAGPLVSNAPSSRLNV